MIIRILFITISLLISTQSAPSPYFTRSLVRTPTSSFEQYLIVPDKSDPYRVPLSQVHHYSDFEFPKQQLVYYNPIAGTNQHGLNTLKRDNSLWQEMLLNLHSNSNENLLASGGSELSKRSDTLEVQENDEPLRMVFDPHNMNSEMVEKLNKDVSKQDEMNILFQESSTFVPEISVDAVSMEKSKSMMETKKDIESMKVMHIQDMNREKIPQDDALPMDKSLSNIDDSLFNDSNLNASSTSGIFDSADMNVNSELLQESSTRKSAIEMALEIVRSAEKFPEIMMKLVEMATERIETNTRQDSVDAPEINGIIMASTSSNEDDFTTMKMTTSTTEQPRNFTTEESSNIPIESGNQELTNSSVLEILSTNLPLNISEEARGLEISPSISEAFTESSTANEQPISTESDINNVDLNENDSSKFAENDIKTEAAQSSVEITKDEIITKFSILEPTEDILVSNINITSTTQLLEEMEDTTQSSVDVSTEESKIPTEAEETLDQIIEQMQRNDLMTDEVLMSGNDMLEQTTENIAEEVRLITTEVANDLFEDRILSENLTQFSEDNPPIDIRVADLDSEPVIGWSTSAPLFSESSTSVSSDQSTTNQISSLMPCLLSTTTTTDRVLCPLLTSTTSSSGIQSTTIPLLRDLPNSSTVQSTTDRILNESSTQSATRQSFDITTEIPSQSMETASTETFEVSSEESRNSNENSTQLNLSPLSLQTIESINSELQESSQNSSEFDQIEISTSTQNSVESINSNDEISSEEMNAPTVESRSSIEIIETTQQPLRNLSELMETEMIDGNLQAENEQDSEEMNVSDEENVENSEIRSELSTRINDNKLNETEISSSEEQITIDSNEKRSDIQQEQITLRTEQNIASRDQPVENEREGRVNKGPTIFLHNNRFYVISGAPEFYANFDAYRNPRTPIFSLQELQPIRPMNNVAVQKIEPFRIYVEDNEEQNSSTQNDNEPLKMENNTRDSLQSDIENEKSMNAEQNESEKRGEMTVKVKKREQDRQPVGEARRDYDYKEEQPIAQSNPAAIAVSGNRGIASAVSRGISFSGIKGFSATSRRSTLIQGKTDLDSSDEIKKLDQFEDTKILTNRNAQLNRRKLKPRGRI